MAEIVPYQRQPKARRKTHGVIARWSYLPWQPLAMLALIATTFATIAFVHAGTHELSKEMENAAVAETIHARHTAAVNVSMPLCRGWPRVNCVIDGDTIWYEGTKIRIADINAPETHDPHCTYEAALGKRATDRMISLLNAGPFDVVTAGDRDEDVYGRKLRLVERNGRSLGQTLVNEGLAERWQGYRRNWCA